MTGFLVGLLLKALGLTAGGPAGLAVATVLPIFASAEAAVLLPILTGLIAQAEANPALATGWDKFKWVAEQDVVQSVIAQKSIPLRILNLLIEGQVQVQKAPAA